MTTSRQAAPDLLPSMSSPLEQVLVEKIHGYLREYLLENAMFLAERLVAHTATEETMYLLATCCYRCGHLNRAISILEKSRRDENRFLLAKCCFDQNKLIEAENALMSATSRNAGDSHATKTVVPNGAAGLFLMGKISRRANRRQQAIECFSKCLKLDPFMWSAYEELCDLGANIEEMRFFGPTSCFERPSSKQVQDQERHDNNNAEVQMDAFATPKPHILEAMEAASFGGMSTPCNPRNASGAEPKQAAASGGGAAFRVGLSRTNPTAGGSTATTAFRTPPNSYTSSNNNFPEVFKKPRVGGAHGNGGGLGRPLRKAARRPLTESDEKHPRSARLSFSSVPEDTPPTTPGPRRIPIGSAFNSPALRVPVGGDGRQERSLQMAQDGVNKSDIFEIGEKELLGLLSAFGAIYRRLSLFECRQALELLELLPMNQLCSGWAQHQLGRAHFELGDYNKAYDVFRSMHCTEPYRMNGMDLFSTTLWHLKKEVEITFLAQEVTDFDKLSPEAWCVAGNCFSLQKEHETALTFFQRAIQLDPYYTYGYTLSGHEYVANEDFEKAIGCYRHAIRTDPRHYNAWYGLGTIYYRQEKFEFAEYHFKRALEINPESSLLHCFLGMVLHSTKKLDEALHVLGVASKLQPLNPQARFQKANVLITQHRLEEALEELKIVRNFAPRESSVHFMMGKVSKKLGRIEDAMQFFTTALYFHPKDNNIIKSAIEKINEPELEEDDRL